MTILDDLAAAAVGSSSAPAGLPDPAMLTKLANAFFAAVPGQPAVIPAGPSQAGVGASPGAATAGASLLEPQLPTGYLPSIPIAPVIGALPLPASDPGIAPAISFAPDASAGTNAAATFAGAAPGQSLPLPSSPSLPGFGSASHSPLAGAPAFGDLPSTSYGIQPSPPEASNSGVPSSVADYSKLPAVAPPIIGLNQPLDATTSQSGSGLSTGRTALPGADASSVPQPPPANPPPQVLPQDNGTHTPSSAGTTNDFKAIPLPFEAELRALIGPLAGESSSAAGAPSVSDLYFLGYAPEAIASPPGSASPFESAHPAFDVTAIRRDFPILNEKVNGKPLVWFDNAATTQKPRAVIERISYFYEHENSNIHRAAHELAARATDAYEGARSKVARFLGASGPEDIIFTRGATEAINLVASTFGQQHVGPGDEIVLTNLEHHANIVPWQMLCLAKGAKLRVAPVDDNGALLLDEFSKLLNNRTKIVAFTQVSNALGTITPAKTIVEMAKRVGARVLIDGAQSVSHMKVDVQDLGADFFVFSGHKLFAPTGIGVLYAKPSLMNHLPPYQSGGNMIRDVRFERTELHSSPQRFEAGTGNIADAVGLGAAIDYVERIGLDVIGKYEHGLLEYATRRLAEVPNLRIIGTAPEKASVISLVIKGLPSEEIGSRLNAYGIAVRSGHHCAQPILRRFGQETTVRPSFAFYNTCGEIDLLISALKEIQAETGIARV